MTMNCDLAMELLPWLLNGTLEAGERRRLVEHLRGCGACRAALADTQVAWDLFDWHPPPAALVSYVEAIEAAAPTARGEATPGARDVEEHLAGCPKCAAELELVRTSRLLADPAEDGRIAILTAPRREEAAAARRAWRRSALAASVAGLLAATGWLESARHSRDLERRLAAAPAPAAARAPAPASAASPATARPRTSPAAAALPAPSGPGQPDQAELRRRAGDAEARLTALAHQNQQLQQQVAALGRTAAELSQRSEALRASQPQAGPRIESDLAVTDVEPAERAERGAGAPAAATVPLSSGAATLLLHTRHRDSYPDYEIEVRDARGRLVGKPTRVLRLPGSQDSFEEFDITLGHGALPPGAYTLHLFGLPGHAGTSAAAATAGAAGTAKAGRETLETYSIRVS
jgi:hypothetical protein